MPPPLRAALASSGFVDLLCRDHLSCRSCRISCGEHPEAAPGLRQDRP